MTQRHGRVRPANNPRTSIRARRLIAALAAGAALGLSMLVPLGAQQSASGAGCRISGRAANTGRPLPGVSIVAEATGAVKAATSTDPDGTYHLALPPGTYRLSAQLTGFTSIERALTVESTRCDQTIDLPLTLAPRGRPATAVPAQTPATRAPGSTPPGAASGTPSRGNQPASGATANGQRFERLAVQTQVPAQNLDVTPAERDSPDAAARLLLPPGFSTEGPTKRSRSTAMWRRSIAG